MNIVAGASNGLFYTCLISGLSFIYREMLDKAIGILKAHTGFGLMFGLLVGTPVYALGGFTLTCYVMALLAVFGSVLILVCIPAAVTEPSKTHRCTQTSSFSPINQSCKFENSSEAIEETEAMRQ